MTRKKTTRPTRAERFYQRMETRLSNPKSMKDRRRGRLILLAVSLTGLASQLFFPDFWSRLGAWEIAWWLIAGLTLGDLLNITFAASFPLLLSPWLPTGKRWSLFGRGFLNCYLAKQTTGSTIFSTAKEADDYYRAKWLARQAKNLPELQRKRVYDLLAGNKLEAARQLLRQLERETERLQAAKEQLLQEAKKYHCLASVERPVQLELLALAETVINRARVLISLAQEIGVDQKVIWLLDRGEPNAAEALLQQAQVEADHQKDLQRLTDMISPVKQPERRRLEQQLDGLRTMTFNDREYRMARYTLVKSLDRVRV